MRVSFDKDADILYVTTGQREATAASLLREFGTTVILATEDGCDVIGFEVLGGSAYLPLGPGYDADRDTLTIGETTCDPDVTTKNGDLIAYWEVDSDEPDGMKDPIGVALRQASKHLASVLDSLAVEQS